MKKNFFLLMLLQFFWQGVFAAPQELEQAKKLEAIEQKKYVSISRPQMAYKAENLRDPFVGRLTEQGGAAVSADQPPALRVEGIVWGGVFPQAIINHKVMKIGDTIENARIIDITKEGVTVFFGGRQYNIASPGALQLEKGKPKKPEEEKTKEAE